MEQFDVVMIKNDIQTDGLKRWQIGTILEIWDEYHFEVEICDFNGVTIFLGALSIDNLELIWRIKSLSYVGRFKALLQTLEELQKFIETSELLVHSSLFNSIREVLQELDLLIRGLKGGTIGIVEKLKFYFAPTGLFQEIALENGWGDRYIDISSRFDSFIT